ncbi:urease (plasmid) [Vibrio sp. HDW18]|uniref:RNA-binding S4 domain-containing protein n=1 Tax=Vibrio sp. HDW18 TaxID=2714948 RepID=UPI001407BC72|nr:RNA-binding S4 domain-containing protein [Vibrio sp. HDW18]QIL86985.1 urease [Vibrio sp. HDW18]
MTDAAFPPQDQEIEIEAIGVEVSNQPIELYKVLKIASAVSGGGEAKHVISEGYVWVNGEVETRKRCKVFDGDLIEFNQEFYVVICDAPVTEAPISKVAVEPKQAKQTQPSLPAKAKPSRKPKQITSNTAPPKANTKPKKPRKNHDDKPSSSERSAIRFF